jgi:RNA-directed DNA polymerase
LIFDKLANELGVPRQFVTALGNGASYEYKTYKIPKKSGGTRTIHHPSRRLKAIQRWLLSNVIETLPRHTAAAAYVKGRGVIDNAEKHASSRFLLRMDFKDFFPSITEKDLNTYMTEHGALFPTFSAGEDLLFQKFLFRQGKLTIGAPTSPAISNVLCHELDSLLNTMCEAKNVIYTRYADDLFFSAITPNLLRDVEKETRDIVSKLRVPSNLKFNSLKTRHSSRKSARRVTGITLGSDGKPYLGRDRKREIRTLIHIFDSLSPAIRETLKGKISFAIGIEPAFLNDLILKYGRKRIQQIRDSPSPKKSPRTKIK